ncbi:TspO/MBR-related protein [Aspergillus varians]
MPYFTLPQAIFTSPVLSTITPITTGCTVGYLVNRHGTKPKYANLQQPPFAPPPWLFGPAWTILYGLTGYAAHHATSTTLVPTTSTSTIQTLYTTQLLLNHLWMPLFFGLRKPGLAAVDILLLGGTVAALMRKLWDADRVAFWLFGPYAAWLGYATYLNFGVGFLNRWRVPGAEDVKGKGREE